jgi:prephenate dehydratase
LIVIFCDNIDDFIKFLDKRTMNEIFYEFKDITSDSLVRKIDIEVVLHFLAKVESTMILYETKQIITKSKNSDIDIEVVKTLNSLFGSVDSSLSLIKGKVREIFLSYSS